MNYSLACLYLCEIVFPRESPTSILKLAYLSQPSQPSTARGFPTLTRLITAKAPPFGSILSADKELKTPQY